MAQPIDEFFVEAIKNNNLKLLQKFAQGIALSVVSDFVNLDKLELSNDPINKLNSSISNSIFNAIVAVANYSNNEIFSEFIAPFLNEAFESDKSPELSPLFESKLSDLFQQTQVVFESPFLNEQFQIGNITFNPHNRLVYLLGSYEFRGIESDGKKHKDKITSHLKKEGFVFKDNGYIKR